MLFFKDLLEEKFEDKAFSEIFKKECHICKNTVRLVARLEANPRALLKTLARNNISQKAYNDLKEGENCNPDIALKLYGDLNMNGDDLRKNCPKLILSLSDQG
ncbi:MAG: hypothetical protein L3J69_02070 [Desulfobacula sp.]|nr:hypothetical protein [Desulfobacula sp.]